MRAYWIVLAVFLAAACSRGEAPKPAEQAASAPVLGVAQCAEPIGVTTERFLTNANEGLEKIKSQAAISENQVVADPCGSVLTMTTSYGMTKVTVDKGNQILSIISGVEQNQNPEENVKKLIDMIQVMISPFTTERMGTADVGKKLFSLSVKTMEDRGNSDSAKNDYEYQDMLYTVVAEKNMIAIMLRKK